MRVFTVLLLEDNAESADIIIRFLEKFNFSVTHVTDGRPGIVKLKNSRFDLIVCDILMPGVDGWRFLERSAGDIGNTPVIVTTALNDRQSVLKGSSFHVAGYLVKPIEQQALLEKVTKALGIAISDLVNKKDHPFKIDVTGTPSSLEITLEGIPEQGSEERLQEWLTNYAGREIVDAEIEMSKVLVYADNPLRFLERIVQLVGKQLKVKPPKIKLFGGFMKTSIAVNGIPQNATLAQCIRK